MLQDVEDPIPMPTAEPLGRASSAHRVVLWVVMTIVAFAALGYMIAH